MAMTIAKVTYAKFPPPNLYKLKQNYTPSQSRTVFTQKKNKKGKRNLVCESGYEYGSRVGIWRILRLFSKYGLKLTCVAAGMALERNPEVGQYLIKAGHELASHQYRWIDYSLVQKEKEIHDLKRCLAIHRSIAGEGTPLQGLYVGRVSENSRRIATEVGDIKWCSDVYDDDLPYWDTKVYSFVECTARSTLHNALQLRRQILKGLF